MRQVRTKDSLSGVLVKNKNCFESFFFFHRKLKELRSLPIFKKLNGKSGIELENTIISHIEQLNGGGSSVDKMIEN